MCLLSCCRLIIIPLSIFYLTEVCSYFLVSWHIDTGVEDFILCKWSWDQKYTRQDKYLAGGGNDESAKNTGLEQQKSGQSPGCLESNRGITRSFLRLGSGLGLEEIDVVKIRKNLLVLLKKETKIKNTYQLG